MAALGARLLSGGRRRGQAGGTLRAQTDKYSRELYEDSDFDVVDRVVELAN